MALDCPYVFVYGTLRRGFANSGRDVLTTHGRLVDEARAEGRLHDLGAYPGMVRAFDEGDEVRGEVHELVREPERGLARLDRYEGARGPDPLPYERRKVPVELAHGTAMEAWTYIWTEDPPRGSLVESGDWVEHVRNRSG